MSKAILNWLARGERGLSSETMAFTALGVKCRASYPCDPDDFNRCLKLLRAAPEVQDSFPAIAALCPEWERIIEHWAIIEQMFLSEVGMDWSKGRRIPATKTYELIKQCIKGQPIPAMGEGE